MKRKHILLLTALSLSLALSGCGKSSTEETGNMTEESTVWETLPAGDQLPAEETQETVEETVVENHDGMYRSEITNEWIDESLKDQRPVAVMIDNEKIALPHYGTAQADVVYEIMNSTENSRVTRLMAIVKDYEKIEQLGSIRSTRPTNLLLAAEWNAILIHDGGPFYIDQYVSKGYTSNLSGGFARFSNGKSAEFTEYVTYDSYSNPKTGKSFDGLKQRLEKSNFSVTYNQYYQGGHFKFSDDTLDLSERSDSINATEIKLPFPHNSSTLKYNEETGTYDYYEYGEAHKDADTGAQLTFTNVLLQNCTFSQLDEHGYLIYNCIDSGRDGYYLTGGKAVPIKWIKSGESDMTVFLDKTTGEQIEMNTGKTYIALVPSDGWSSMEIN